MPESKKYVGNTSAMADTSACVKDPHGPVMLSGPSGIGKYSFLMSRLEAEIGLESVTSIDAADGIDSVRSAIESGMSVPDARYGAIVIRGAESVSDASQDALLKSLEEQPDGTTYFLICDDAGLVRESIKSRIRTHISWHPLSRDELLQITNDEFAIGVSFGSAQLCSLAVGDKELRRLYDACADPQWPSKAIVNPVPSVLSKEGANAQLICNVLRLSARTSRYANQLLQFSSRISKTPSINLSNHYLSAAAAALAV